MLKKFLQDYLAYQKSRLVGGRKYSDWLKNTIALQENVFIKNTALAKELEKACNKNGFLTYAQFLDIIQFGENGYHNTHKHHGMTDVRFNWPKALVKLCQQENVHAISEFGPGDGKVGVLTLQEAKKQNYPLFWSGVEINKKLREKIKTAFAKKHLQNHLHQVVATLEELQLSKPCLFVFSYSLDNLPPELFINTTENLHFPNALLGIQVQNGYLCEVILTEKNLQQIHRRLENGIYTDEKGYSWDMSTWQLKQMQRVYVPLASFTTLLAVQKQLPKNSFVLILDEFSFSNAQTYHLGVPRDLEIYTRDCTDFGKFYKDIGNWLLYYPLLLQPTLSFLSQAGFSVAEKMGEKQFAKKLLGETTDREKLTRIYGILLEKEEEKQKKIFSLHLD